MKIKSTHFPFPEESSRAAQNGYLLKGTCGVVEIAYDL